MTTTDPRDVRMDPFPKQDEIWKTASGRLVKIDYSQCFMPGPLERIYAEVADDKGNSAALGVFWLNGHAVMGKDHLVERVS